jgi:prephenate dehydrogenase
MNDPAPSANVIGCGLIGGSVGLGLRKAGWTVTGTDHDEATAARALALGALDEVGIDNGAAITFVCTPVGAVADAARRALSATTGVVTDVGSVKRSIVDAVADPRFVGGHPMAGSEQDGVDGADADLFQGATWVLTPTEATDPSSYTAVRSAIAALGAEVVAITPERHDELVALVSHVPHLTAGALMTLADASAAEHATVLRLAAGGFRDMTRIAAGHPGIWPDICAANSEAIVETLDQLIEQLGAARSLIASGDRQALLDRLERARAARRNLPPRTHARPSSLAEVRVPVPDRPGVLAEITTLLGELGVNIVDIEIVHSAEGQAGVLLVLVDADHGELVRGMLHTRGYRPHVERLTE